MARSTPGHFIQPGTCDRCQSAAHAAEGCREGQGEDEGERMLRDLAARMGWSECPACGQMVERVSGCNRMSEFRSLFPSCPPPQGAPKMLAWRNRRGLRSCT